MALKLLNPGLRPLGMFDLADANAGSLNGGEYVELAASDSTGAGEGYAADVGAMSDDGGDSVMFTLAPRSALSLGGLADEGGDEYGTLFGSLIGQNAGRATLQSGAVVVGPTTDRASGKVTVWAQAGLYGVTDQSDTLDNAGSAANTAVFAADGVADLENDGVTLTGIGLMTLDTTSGNDQVGIYVGAMSDSSLVSTTNAAAGEAAGTEYHAIFYTGNAQA
jgi:hypothetical protein